ncbi:MAG TPA: hypothetical protein VFZ53_32700 [Polyangiaceae bacterium]
MSNVWYAFQACGFASFLMLLVAMLALPFSLVAVALAIARTKSAKLFALLALTFSLLPVAVGATGMTLARAKVDSVLDGNLIDRGLRERIRAEGYEEAAVCLRLGFGTGAVPLLFALVAVGFALALSPRRTAG